MSGFFERLLGRTSSKGSGTTAKERLQFILVHDRINLPPERLQAMKAEILEVISKYVSVDSDDVDIFLDAGEIHRAMRFGDPNREFWMSRMEEGEARDQPLHRQRADAGNVQFAIARRADVDEDLLQVVEGAAERAGHPLAGVREFQGVAGSLGELDADRQLQAADLAADRPVGHAKLVRGQAHLAQPREGFKGPQGRQRQLAALRHVTSAHKHRPAYSAAHTPS